MNASVRRRLRLVTIILLTLPAWCLGLVALWKAGQP